MPTQAIEGYPLSLQQNRCWTIVDEFGRGQLHTEAECVLEGKLDREKLEVALRGFLQRHEICRCEIIEGPSGPVAVVAEDSHAGASDQRRFRWDLKTEESGAQVLHLEFPAELADATSIGLLLRELSGEYGRLSGSAPEADEPMQYLDYAQWQLDLQTTPEARIAQQFWRDATEGESTIPLEKAGDGFAIGSENAHLDSAAEERLRGCAEASGTSRSIVVAAAWAAFLGRLIERPGEVAVGILSSGRTFDELNEALGPYDRYLPVKLAADSDKPAAELIRTVAGAIAETQQHQEFFGGAETEADSALSFLFAHCRPIEEIRAGDLTFKVRRMESHTEPFKLKLDFVEGELPELRLFYNARRISSEYAGVIAKRFKTFLNEFVSRTEAPVGGLKCICAREWEVVAQNFPRSTAASPKRATVIEMFADGVKLHPQRPAVICGGAILTYAELNERANDLADRLSQLGVRRGAAVAISAERSMEMIVGLMGIQKAGGAYVPLDPGYPKERLSFVLQDCGARVLVAQRHLVSKLPRHDCAVVHLEEKGEFAGELNVQIDPADAAYVIYTSGSTGQPKGVPISHRNLAFSTAARFEYYREAIANYLLLSSFAFDSSIAGIFWTLAQGGTLTLPREGTHQDPRELLRLIREYKVSHLLALPSFYNAILEMARDGELDSLRTAIVAGEACSVELARRHYAKAPQATLFNEYGPTEGTVWATVHRCEAKEEGQVPIGRPVPNMSVYILDEEQKAVGIGQAGEICIGGPALARGYLNRDELTQQKFVPNPFHLTESEAPEVLYRTGDLGRFRMDGMIEFHGRMDEQVKIRGYRIEIGEVENVLAGHQAVREGVVVAREDSPGDKRLVGYVVAREGMQLSIPDLRLFAREKLPAFMVPSQFVLVASLPLTPNGKIDRKALPAPEELERGEGRFVAPRTEDEEQLARIWTEVLKLEKVGLGENFFDLGGHSLLAIRVIARVRDLFKVDFPMAAFFEAPTIDGMAAALGRYLERNGRKEGAHRGIPRAARVVAPEGLLRELSSSQ